MGQMHPALRGFIRYVMAVSNYLLVLLILLSSPAFADGTPTVLSLLVIGGPLAPLLASIWGLRQARNLTSRRERWVAALLTIPASVTGYFLGFDLLVWMEWPGKVGLGLIFGPLLFCISSIFGRVPSFLLENAES